MSRPASPVVATPLRAAKSATIPAAVSGPAIARSVREELTGYGMSFVLHLVLLLGLTLVTLVQVEPSRRSPVTVSTLAAESVVDDVVPVEIIPGDGDGTLRDEIGGLSMSPLLVPSSSRRYADLPLAATAKPGNSVAGATLSGRGSGWELPPHAVQAGSFAAWWIPKVERYGERVEAGQLPRVGQAYRIHVQIRVPDDRRSLRVEDLSGEIVGTDGYKQLIPDRAWVMDDAGELVRAVGNRSFLPVRGGLVEVVFKVDAAGRAGVRDTIRVRSRILREEQTLTLEFTAVPAAGEQ